jgi:inorganic pyrophosphatase
MTKVDVMPKVGILNMNINMIKKNMLVCDRILYTQMKYLFNYGFIPNTLSEDEKLDNSLYY